MPEIPTPKEVWRIEIYDMDAREWKTIKKPHPLNPKMVYGDATYDSKKEAEKYAQKFKNDESVSSVLVVSPDGTKYRI